MRIPSTSRSRTVAAAVFALAFSAAGTVAAAPCPTNLPNSIYGSGGSAVNPTLSRIAKALRKLEEPVNIFYAAPSACTGYAHLAYPSRGKTATFLYWPDDNAPVNGVSCDATGNEEIAFSHMGNTPFLCSDATDVPDGIRRFIWPVQTINLITNYGSNQNSISAEALKLIYGNGSAAVLPWTDRDGISARSATSFVHLIVAGAINVSAQAFQSGVVFGTNEATVDFNDNWVKVSAKDPKLPLGYVSGSNATEGEAAQRVKTLAYQHYGQSCGYLPDSDRGKFDKLNVRNGQYYLSTPAWLYAKVDGNGKPVNPHVERLIRYVDGSLAQPEINILDEVIASGDIPLCALNAIRAQGDLSPFQSYAPEEPCHGYFEFKATGETSLQRCEGDADCDVAAGEKCRGYETVVDPDESTETEFLGFCEYK